MKFKQKIKELLDPEYAIEKRAIRKKEEKNAKEARDRMATSDLTEWDKKANNLIEKASDIESNIRQMIAHSDKDAAARKIFSSKIRSEERDEQENKLRAINDDIKEKIKSLKPEEVTKDKKGKIISDDKELQRLVKDRARQHKTFSQEIKKLEALRKELD